MCNGLIPGHCVCVCVFRGLFFLVSGRLIHTSTLIHGRGLSEGVGFVEVSRSQSPASDGDPLRFFTLDMPCEEPEPPRLTAEDAIVVREGERDAHNANAKWEAMRTFHRAPCLKPSLGLAAIGGSFVGALRLLTGSGGRTAFTWGSVVAGLLSGTSWFTCRRQMYMNVRKEVDLLERVQQGDAQALIEYQELLEARSEQQRIALQSRKDAQDAQDGK